MTLIELKAPAKFNGYVEIPYRFTLPIPESLKGIQNKKEIAKSYDNRYDIITIDGEEYFTIEGKYTTSNDDAPSEIKATIITIYNDAVEELNAFKLAKADSLVGLCYDGTGWSLLN